MEDLDLRTVKVFLKQGAIINATYEVDEYDDIYDSWKEGRKHMTFYNCEILTSEVAAIQWE